MLQTEYLRSLNSNYERVLLEGKPEERKYQYCILSRGGIKGLLSCSLRLINGDAYLYYDISSKQNITQIYDKRVINRKWMKDFFWSLRQIRLELGRFLLDERNVLWYPQQIFQDLENNIFSFLYVPYYEGDNGFRQLLEYFVEHIDYEDETLVECVYKMYEQFEEAGETYLQEQIFVDAKRLDAETGREKEESLEVSGTRQEWAVQQKGKPEIVEAGERLGHTATGEAGENSERTAGAAGRQSRPELPLADVGAEKREKRGLLSLFDSRKKKEKGVQDGYEQAIPQGMNGYVVAEDTPYEEEEWGQTVYIEEEAVPRERRHRLCTQEGRMVMLLDKASVTIGKKREEADLVLEDLSVSRMHARIVREQDGMYLEDLNSTNGTFKNGLRMQPYEKRKLEEGDEIRFGKKEFVYY